MLKADWELFNQLIQQEESSTLDFKEQLYPSKNASFLHDILCLANADSDQNRYLVFGVSDNKELKGLLEKTAAKWKQADINDWLRTLSLNRIPKIRFFKLEHENKAFAVLEIENLPLKPYCLKRDFPSKETESDKRVKAHAIYVRNGCSNTPINSTANEEELDLIWIERFGLSSSILERMHRYLQPEYVANWKKMSTKYHMEAFYYENHPEFTIEAIPYDDEGQFTEPFTEPWTSNTSWPDKKVTRSRFYLKYHATVLKELYILNFDGCRHYGPTPSEKGEINKVTWFFKEKENDFAFNLGYLLEYQRKELSIKGYRDLLKSCNLPYTYAPLF